MYGIWLKQLIIKRVLPLNELLNPPTGNAMVWNLGSGVCLYLCQNVYCHTAM